MHILFSMGTGGMETVVRKLLRGLDPEQFEQTICTITNDGKVEVEGIHRINMGRAHGQGAPMFFPLFQVFRREQPDVVHSRNWSAIEAVPAAKLARIAKVIHSEHGRDFGTMDGEPLRRRLFRKFAYSLCDAKFCVSAELKQHYRSLLGAAADGFEVISNGVDTECFRPNPTARAAVRARLSISPECFLVGAVGRLDRIKDYGTLLRATAGLAEAGIDAHVVIAGNGPARVDLDRLAAEIDGLRNRVHFLGDVRDVYAWLPGFDAFVQPSLSEGMSNTILEAMASGCAVAATNVGGNPELVEDGESGVLFAPKDHHRLAELLTKIATEESFASRLRVNARERVARYFSDEQMLRNYASLYGGRAASVLATETKMTAAR